MNFLILYLLLTPFPQQEVARPERSRDVRELVDQITESGQVLQIAVAPEDRLDSTPRIAPGDPPLLAFRYFEGQAKHRFGKLDLVMDDAGH
jgi:hypothetical protein